ncbi:MAG TPA: hypothetical protein VGB32_03320 [Candidatus Bathyarchaeia archaeon]
MIEEKPNHGVMEALLGPVDCLLAGEWGFTRVKDIPLTGEWSRVINEAPIAVHVCLNHECAVKLKRSLWDISPLSPEIVREGRVDVARVGRELVDVAGEAAFAAIAGGLGLKLNEYLSLLGSVALYVAANATIVATQLELFEKGNGVCLHKGPLPWPFPVKVGPLLLDIPVIVSPRVASG